MSALAAIVPSLADSRLRLLTNGDADQLGGHAVASLIDEVTLAPKPGLVDIRSSGAHKDLSWSLMCASAYALFPTFCELARAGTNAPTTIELREHVGALGRCGEQVMLQATRGVNTHRGAIWALGLLVTAAAQAPGDRAPARIAARAGALARLPDRYAPARTGLKGEQACHDYGVGGARGQARAEFPHVVHVALPKLWRSRRCGHGESAARLNALLAIMGSLDDTCVLARGGRDALTAVQHGANRVLDYGGAGELAGRRHLKALDRQLIDLNVSPGGAADLLSATLLLDRLVDKDNGQLAN
jgi:triphosphoribosyl-dephospho-CoA synthase